MAATGARWLEAEILHSKGKIGLLVDRKDDGGSEDCFKQALTSAQSQNAKSLELRVATSLARLWRNQGNVAQAKDVLARVYGGFTEGFDTPDLVGARALLDELT